MRLVSAFGAFSMVERLVETCARRSLAMPRTYRHAWHSLLRGISDSHAIFCGYKVK